MAANPPSRASLRKNSRRGGRVIASSLPHVGWVERETHRFGFAARRWVSLRSTHPTRTRFGNRLYFAGGFLYRLGRERRENSMKLCRFDEDMLGVVIGDKVHDV